ncbi:hypothetical protein COCOBI_01-7140 [Coccomyxa sp. Obi]|nr:hypothetical protein COCOBI_01-7140 [Coccomyxa sp. Obi]
MENKPSEDTAPKEDLWWYRKTRRGWVKEKVTEKEENKAARVQSNSEKGGGDRLVRNDEDNFEDVADSSATQTESSSRTSRSASPRNAHASLESEGDQSGKAKRKKRKNHKRKTAQVPLSSYALGAAIREAKANYGADPIKQLQSVAEIFIKHYHNSEVAFHKTLQEQPLQKVADMPLDSVPREVVEQAMAFYKEFSLPILHNFWRTLVDAMFDDLPESPTFPAQEPNVGLLMSLALVLRALPVVAMMHSETILQDNARYTSPERLPYLLWMLAQAAIGDVSVGVAVWVRVLLPRVLGTQRSSKKNRALPKLADESAAAVLGFLDLCLAAVQPPDEPEELNLRGYPKWNAGTVALGPEENALVHGAQQGIRWTSAKGKCIIEPVVPPAALDAIVRLTFQSKPVLSAKNNARLHRQYERLQDLAIQGIANGAVSLPELVRLSLEAAAGAAKGGPAAEPLIVEEAARTLVKCLISASSATTDAWQASSGRQLLGSAAVLQHLAANLPLQLDNAEGHQIVLDLVQALQQKYSQMVASGKAPLVAAAQTADGACDAVKAKMTRKTGGTRLAVLGAFVLAGGSLMAAIALSQTKPVQDFASQSDSALIRAAVTGLSTVAEQLPPTMLHLAEEAGGLAESLHEKVHPLFEHVHDALDGAYDFVAAYSVQGLQAASMVQQTVSARIHNLIAS